jgi:predicted metal-dependent hydrolase
MSETTHDIIPRDLRFGILEHADRAWFDGDPVKSAIVDGFAVLLPVGERFFIRSLKHYAPQIGDQEILDGMQGYALQEAFHTREHEAYNAALRKLGADIERLTAATTARLGSIESPIMRLAITCAIEQVTYSFSRFALGRNGAMDRAAPAYRRLWRWHALEEVEHAAVALRVFHAAPWSGPRWKKYALRIAGMNVTALLLTRWALENAATLLRGPDGRLGWRIRLRIAWALLVSPGFMRAMVVPYLLYLKPGYLGGGSGDRRLVERGRRLLREDRAPA